MIEDLQNELKDVKEQLTCHQDELSGAKAEITELQKKVTEFEATIESNENMISWLNKQLNELQGLSDLNKFRANLSQHPEPSGRNEIHQPVVTVPRNPSNSAKLPSARQGLSKTLGEIQNINAPSSINNTVGGGSPSWLHIYQSTGNHTERDLSSRLEHVSALGAILHSQNKTGTKDTSKTSPEHEAPKENLNEKSGKPNNDNRVSRQPSWAKSKPKVTLDTMLNKPTFPIWKNK